MNEGQKTFPAEAPVDLLYGISQVIARCSDWREAFDELAREIRSDWIYDNLAVYLRESPGSPLEVRYARAMGRGRTGEADIPWGDSLAQLTVQQEKTIVQEPDNTAEPDRIKRPYLLGIPISVCGSKTCGAIVFIRFGGPPFTPENIALAEFISQQIAHLITREMLQIEIDGLRSAGKQARLQEDFVSTITHELRSPLGFIKGYTTTLLRSDTTWDQNIQQEFLQIIDRETDHLEELIENLLDSARLQSGQLNIRFEPIRLDAIVKDLIARDKTNHPELKIDLFYDTPTRPVSGDPRRLMQVFENLVGNAYKYAPGSPVHIHIQEREDGAHILFVDAGPGIAPEYLEHVFERFFRVPNHSPTTHGSGLGLFICKQIIEMHHGSITARSNPDKGCTFEITLPYQPLPDS